jgi:hypothetical protein
MNASTQPAYTAPEDADIAWLRGLGVLAEGVQLDTRAAPDDAAWVREAVERNERAEARRAANRPIWSSPLLAAIRRRSSTKMSSVYRSEVAGVSQRSVQRGAEIAERTSSTSGARSATFGGAPVGSKRAANRAGLVEELNARELQLVTKSLTLYRRGLTKQEAIEAVWGCTKGGGKVWRRASALFDAALAAGDDT